MKKRSAGILMYRFINNVTEVLLAHPGGPFHRNRDLGAWSIPKGEFSDEESARDAALREFREEVGGEVSGILLELTPVKQKAGKEVLAWASEGDFDPGKLVSNTFPIEWPPHSGKIREFPEVDRVEWFGLDLARKKIIPGQVPLLDELKDLLKIDNR